MKKNTCKIEVKTSSGFFGLNEFHFLSRSLLPVVMKNKDKQYIFDFTNVEVWDVSILLWLIIGLNFYKQNGIVFSIRLPMSNPLMPEDDKIKFDKSADYLRRWKFDEGLKNITSDIHSLLVPEQENYFDNGPLKYYLPSTKEILLEDGMTANLVSRGLGPIANLVDLSKSGQKKIENSKITECISAFEKSKIAHILYYKCNIPFLTAKNYVTHLLAEALNNTLEHPNATIGLIAVSVLGAKNELILSVVDNGFSIPSTIYDVFLSNRKISNIDYDNLPKTYSKKNLKTNDIAVITDYATHPGVTSKKSGVGGYGLTYIKNGTEDFKGNFDIITDSVRVEYNYKNEMNFDWIPYKNHWTGNMLRVSIPINVENKN